MCFRNPKKEPAILRFLKHFNDVLIYVLMGAAVITFLLGHYIDTSVIILVIVINATIGFFQESKAEKSTRRHTRNAVFKSNSGPQRYENGHSFCRASIRGYRCFKRRR
nr:cation-transporting P-type ATPase [Planococcus glaciei]